MQNICWKKIFKNDLKRLQNIANNGNADAMFALSEYYFKKGKNSPEYEKGKEYFERLCTKHRLIF